MSELGQGYWVAALSGLVATVTLVAITLAGLRLGRRAAPFLKERSSLSVAVVRPLCGLERFSEETLASGFRLDYPNYELVFCVASSADPVIPLARRLMDAHPHIPARLLVGDDRISDNPKLNNCVKGWEAADRDWVILADSNVLMPANYIDRMLAAWRPDTGLVCSTPIGARPEGFWAEVECAFLNTLQARWQYAGEMLGLGFAQGKSMLWHKPLLESRGGIRALASDIAEDAAATKLVRSAGLKVHLVDRPFDQPLGVRELAEIWARQLRWARLRRVTFPLFFAPEVLTSPVLPALALATLAGLPALAAVGAVLAFLALWYGAEIALARRAGWHLSWRMPAAFLVRDLIIPPLWAAAFATRNVVWRGNAMHLATKGSADIAPGASRA